MLQFMLLKVKLSLMMLQSMLKVLLSLNMFQLMLQMIGSPHLFLIAPRPPAKF